MFTIKEYVPANEIWSSSTTYIDKGHRTGYVRGYNVEVQCKDGNLTWLSAEWIHSDPREHFDDDFFRWYLLEHDWTLTGRICFRGYGIEDYDPAERDTFIIGVGQL